jgi:hypothetical protein
MAFGTHHLITPLKQAVKERPSAYSCQGAAAIMSAVTSTETPLSLFREEYLNPENLGVRVGAASEAEREKDRIFDRRLASGVKLMREAKIGDPFKVRSSGGLSVAGFDDLKCLRMASWNSYANASVCGRR